MPTTLSVLTPTPSKKDVLVVHDYFLVLHDYPQQSVEKLWREFLKRIDSPAHYDAPEYFLEPYWAGKRPFAVLAIDRGRVIGVLTGLHGKDEITCGAPSRPQIQVDPSAAAEATYLLVEGLLEEAQDEALITVFSWGDAALPAFAQHAFHCRELAGAVVLDLSLGSDALFRQFHENRRRNIRAAIRNGIQVIEAKTQEDLAGYWRVYSAWRQTKRKKIEHNHSFATVEKVHGIRRNHLRFLAVFQGEVIAATGLRFLSGGLVEYANNCSLDEFMYLRPNDLILWKTVQWACEQGFKRYSMGGTNPFLRKSGGTVVPTHRYRLDRSFLHHHLLQEQIRAKVRSVLHWMH